MTATSQLAQTTLRSVLGQHELDEMLAEREKLNADLQRILDEQTESWGIKVANVELKHVDIDESMIRVIARQAEAERIRRAKIIESEGEFQAAAEVPRCRDHPRAAAGGDAAALSLDAHDDRQRALLDDRLPVPDRPRADVRRRRPQGPQHGGISPRPQALAPCQASIARAKQVALLLRSGTNGFASRRQRCLAFRQA